MTGAASSDGRDPTGRHCASCDLLVYPVWVGPPEKPPGTCIHDHGHDPRGCDEVIGGLYTTLNLRESGAPYDPYRAGLQKALGLSDADVRRLGEASIERDRREEEEECDGEPE
ncbi:MAG: hypothetical protein IBJ15_02170 [Alphaproteobacteria bacterium]|nr:hypothetical protein [Alphaproteobacteria bacterium]